MGKRERGDRDVPRADHLVIVGASARASFDEPLVVVGEAAVRAPREEGLVAHAREFGDEALEVRRVDASPAPRTEGRAA